MVTHGLYKLETVGDAYIAAGGLFEAEHSDLAMKSPRMLRNLGVAAIKPQQNSRSVLPRNLQMRHSKTMQSAAAEKRVHMDSVLNAALKMLVSKLSGLPCRHISPRSADI